MAYENKSRQIYIFLRNREVVGLEKKVLMKVPECLDEKNRM